MNTGTVNIGIVGASGVVGETFLLLMDERSFPLGELRLFASEASSGKTRTCRGQTAEIQTLTENCLDGLDLVFFSSGESISEQWAPKAAQVGAIAVDNSSAFRMRAEVPLVVPEINAHLIPGRHQGAIVANPNCSTIQLVLVLHPLAKAFGLKTVRVATYQSVSGAGRAGIEELFEHSRLSLNGEDPSESAVFPAPIGFNCIPQIGAIGPEGFCSEELKIANETPKILGQPDLAVSAFTVRVPTLNAHAEAVWVTLDRVVESSREIEDCLREFPGIRVVGSGDGLGYATQREASGDNLTFVGRVHRDRHDPHTWLLWIVSDNLRKGAALNGLQIAEHVFDLDR